MTTTRIGREARDRDLFMAEDAERFFKKSAGKPYQPSNGTEGEMFMSRWCAGCVKDAAFRADIGDSCPIVAAAMIFDRNDPEYPKEWVYGDDGQPKCTAFEEEAR